MSTYTGSEKDELKARIEAKRKELEAQLASLRAEATAASNESAKRIESSLSDLQQRIAEGWENMSEEAARKLNDWLAKH